MICFPTNEILYNCFFKRDFLYTGVFVRLFSWDATFRHFLHHGDTFLTCWWTNSADSFIISQTAGLRWMRGPSQSRAIAGGERLNVCIRMCLPPPSMLKRPSFRIPHHNSRGLSMSSFFGVSQEIDWWITSWCHCGGLVTISEMIVSACLHISVIDSPNPKHSPLSTSYDGTLDWNHSGWGGVRAICYLLPARCTTGTPFPSPPRSPLPTPPSLQHPAIPQPPPAHPLPPVFSLREHIMVIRQYVCIGINQGKSPLQELWHGEICL